MCFISFDKRKDILSPQALCRIVRIEVKAVAIGHISQKQVFFPKVLSVYWLKLLSST